MSTQIEPLLTEFDRANRLLRERLAGIGSAEYLWEPVDGCWTVRPRETAMSSRPYGRGDWVFDNAPDEPSPPPLTTLAWRLMHLVDVIGGYHVFLWGDGQLSDDWFEVPSTAAAGVALWEHHAAAFTQELATEDAASLQRAVRIPWWPAPSPRWRVVANVITEATHHGAEIGVLRDLYLRRSSWRG